MTGTRALNQSESSNSGVNNKLTWNMELDDFQLALDTPNRASLQ
jgi:hypothetical protein